MEAGEMSEAGEFPPDSVYGRAQVRLRAFAANRGGAGPEAG
jgi:hypothetical protein